MVQLVLNLAHALVPGAFTRRIHTKVSHDTTFWEKLLQCLFPVLPVFCQKVLIDGAGGGIDTAVLFRIIKQFLTRGSVIRIRLVLEHLQFALQAGDLGIKGRDFASLCFQQSDSRRKSSSVAQFLNRGRLLSSSKFMLFSFCGLCSRLLNI